MARRPIPAEESANHRTIRRVFIPCPSRPVSDGSHSKRIQAIQKRNLLRGIRKRSAYECGDGERGYFFLIMSFKLQGKINVLESQPRLSVDANKSFIFMQDFISNVIGSSTEVDFETRLRLENEVRAINDPDILSKWKAFIASKNESEAQGHVLSILQRLIILVQSGAEVAI